VFDRLKQSLKISVHGKKSTSSPANPSVPTTPPSTGATPTPVTPDTNSTNVSHRNKIKVSFVKDPEQGYIKDMRKKRKYTRKHLLQRQGTPSQPTTPSSDENSPTQQQPTPDVRHYFLRSTIRTLSLRRKRGQRKSNGNGTTVNEQKAGMNNDTPNAICGSGATADQNNATTMSNPTGAIPSDATTKTPSGQARKVLVPKKRDTLKDRIAGKPHQTHGSPDPIHTSPMIVPSAPTVSCPQQRQCDNGDTDNETPGHVQALQEILDNQKNNQQQPWNLLLFTMLDDHLSGDTPSLSDSTLQTIDINEVVGFDLPCTELDLENQPPQGIIQIHPDLLQDKDYYPMMTDEEKDEYERDLKTLENINSLKVLIDNYQYKIENDICGDFTSMDTMSNLIEDYIAEMDKANEDLAHLTLNVLPALQARTQHRNTMLQSRMQTWLRKPLSKEEQNDAR
jgi:hypothetical protein